MTNEEGGRRLKAVALALNIKVTELGAKIGVKEQQMYDWTSGKVSLKWQSLVKIVNAFPEVSAEFLLRGTGSPLLTK